MRNILLFFTLMLATGLALAQSNSPFFTSEASSNTEGLDETGNASLIDSSKPNQSRADLEAVIAETFFLRIRAGIASDDEMRRWRVYSRFNLNDQQAKILHDSIVSWGSRSDSAATDRVNQMCAYWSSQRGAQGSQIVAEAAIELYDSLEPTKEDVGRQLQILVDDIESRLGEDFVIGLMSELDEDYKNRRDISYTSWASTVRAQNTAVEQLQFTCGGGV